MMKIVTSFGPSRIGRQQTCLRSWLNAGYEVIAIQSAGEANKFSEHFPGAVFVETDLVGDKFGKPTFVRIKAMTDQAKDCNVLIVNSDLELVGNLAKFSSYWSQISPLILKVGIRWNVNPSGKIKRVFKWGIDAFLITPQIAMDLPDIGFAIGCPAWDYWIPYHLVTRCGYSVVTNMEHHLSHEVHARSWSNQDYETGLGIMKDEYGIEKTPLANFIQEKTGRRHLKHWLGAK